MVELFANSREPDRTPRSAASDLGLHCFAKYPFRGIQATMDQKDLNRNEANSCL